jgi:hypothetical protein
MIQPAILIKIPLTMTIRKLTRQTQSVTLVTRKIEHSQQVTVIKGPSFRENESYFFLFFLFYCRIYPFCLSFPSPVLAFPGLFCPVFTKLPFPEVQ